MFYQVRVSKKEEMMQLFVWKFKGENKLRTFCMTRLVMGNKPSTNISIVAVQQCTKLHDFESRLPEACSTLLNDIYVDNVFITAPDLETLSKRIGDVEEVSQAGGFRFKEWMVTKQASSEDRVVSLQTYEDVEKALGLHWSLVDDELFVRLTLDEFDSKFFERQAFPVTVKPKLTLKLCLHFHMKVFDPLGLVMPTKMIGSFLFRRTLQIVKKAERGRIPWDEVLSDSLLEEWLEYLDMLRSLDSVRFPRSFKPAGVDHTIAPELVTFADGNPDSFGTVAYARWKMMDSSVVVRIIGSKAKLAPLLKKSETVRNELNAATFAVRLKSWITQVLEFLLGGTFRS